MTSGTAALTRREKRERQRSERRERILAAARKVFASEGFEGTTIADVAREAGVASGTVYLYYASKLHLFAALYEQLFAVIGSAITTEDAPPDMPGGTRARVHSVFTACREHRDLLRLVFLNQDPRPEAAGMMQRAEGERLEPLAGLLRGGMATGAVRQADAMMLARLLIGVATVALYQCFVLSDGRDVQTYEEIVTAMIIAALAPAEAAAAATRTAALQR